MADSQHEPGDLGLFLLRVAAALNTSGLTVDDVQRRVERIARAYGTTSIRVSAFPTFVMIALSDGEPTTLEVTPMGADSHRLDQIVALERLCARAERGEVDIPRALAQLAEIEDQPPRFGTMVSIIGYAVLSAGLCLVLRPSRHEVTAAAVLGLLVGALQPLVRPRPPLRVLLPVLAAFLVAAVSGFATRAGLIDTGIRPIVASLIVFLPGATLTAAVLELGSGQLVSGASRLVSGIMSLALLAFGILAGTEVAGVSTTQALSGSSHLLGPWAPWLGVGLFALGVALTNSAPKGAMTGLLIVLYAAWAAQLSGNALWGSHMGAFTGAVVLVLAASLLARLPTMVPRQASFLPGFWLLVPGALGLIGLTSWATSDGTSPSADLRLTAGSIFAVAVGVLVGTQVWDWVVSGGTAVSRYSKEPTRIGRFVATFKRSGRAP
ncbi:threonine/serine ThrE exporter family protein [Aquihabitans sp. McL0605]|uniref:threonine/serine ThrE exporter family protein n=1 Tax=Aquihabitans sp. McL0605 TaxID=3415671 RepID=UPI003CF7B4BA